MSLNNYSPAKVTACGLLIYKAGGVSGATKSGLSFIKADNNFHANEQDICNFGKGGTFSPHHIGHASPIQGRGRLRTAPPPFASCVSPRRCNRRAL